LARLLDGIFGHQNNLHRLLEARQKGQLPSTFLFVGPHGVGKKSFAIAFAQTLLCEKSSSACGECGPCLRLARRNSEGFLFIEPEKNQIKIEQARRVLDFLSLRSMSAARIIVIDGAEYLNPQASNALLKILEEPPPQTYFFLIAPSSEHVLTTIRSRCQVVQFAPLKSEEMRRKANAPEWVLRASQGSFSRLAELSEPEALSAREQALRFLDMWLVEPKAYLLPEWREMIRDRQDAALLARHLSLLLRDAVMWQAGERQQILNPDKNKILAEIAERLSVIKLQEMAGQVLQLENSLQSHRDSQLIFEEFWLLSQGSSNEQVG
jgi:DNA polymerase III subunit delta'